MNTAKEIALRERNIAWLAFEAGYLQCLAARASALSIEDRYAEAQEEAEKYLQRPDAHDDRA